MLFEDENFQSSLFKCRVDKLIHHVDYAFKTTCPDVPGLFGNNHPQTWAEDAVKLKQALMIGQNDYRIHHCKPGAQFDSAWMAAEDALGFPVADNKAQGKVVTTCLFPALTEQEPVPFGESLAVADILVSNKRFYPDLNEKRGLDVKKVISKATVLIL
jgi:hypothetical protein